MDSTQYKDIYGMGVRVKLCLYKYGILAQHRLDCQVISLGNITVGGAGKTPLLIALATEALRRGLRVGIVSRGYGGGTSAFPLLVDANTTTSECGDEPAMMAQRLGVPVVIDPDRARAVSALEARCDVILSDDGLQHYALARDIEIVVVDAERGFGNGLCLPAGPLREPLSRLRSVDFRVATGRDLSQRLPALFSFVEMQLQPSACVNVSTGERVRTENFFQQQKVHAVAGIGNPRRFFDLLRSLGLSVIEHPFADHHGFVVADLQFGDEVPIVMTEKDAVKCRSMALRDAWYVEVNAVLPKTFLDALVQRLSSLA